MTYASCGYFASKNIKIASVNKKLSSKNRRVGVKLVDTVYVPGTVPVDQFSTLSVSTRSTQRRCSCPQPYHGMSTSLDFGTLVKNIFSPSRSASPHRPLPKLKTGTFCITWNQTDPTKWKGVELTQLCSSVNPAKFMTLACYQFNFTITLCQQRQLDLLSSILTLGRVNSKTSTLETYGCCIGWSIP